MGHEALEPFIQGGAMGLCVLFIIVLFYVLKQLLGNISKDVRHIKNIVDGLPCRSGYVCPDEETER